MAILADRIREKHNLNADADVGVKAMLSEVKEASPGTVTAVANTAAIDLEDEVVVPGGAELDANRQPVYFGTAKAIYLNHDYGVLPIGTLRNVRLSPAGWVIQWAPSKTATAQDCMVLVGEGALNGMSIGFIRKDAGPPTEDEVKRYGMARVVTRRWLWLETSLTAMPCNPEAWITGVKSAPDDATVEKVSKALERGLIRPETADILGVARRKKIVSIWQKPGA